MKAFQFLQYAMFVGQVVATFLLPVALVYVIKAAHTFIKYVKGAD